MKPASAVPARRMCVPSMYHPYVLERNCSGQEGVVVCMCVPPRPCDERSYLVERQVFSIFMFTIHGKYAAVVLLTV